MTTEPKYDTIYQIKNILRDKRIIDNFYSDNKNHFSDFLLSILNDKRYDFIARAEVAGDELYKIVNKNSEDQNELILINDKLSLQKILLDCLIQKLDGLSDYDDSIYQFYVKNLDEIKPESRTIVITKDANKIMKEFILLHPIRYLRKYFLREHPEPSFKGKYFYLDPFLLYYFEDSWDTVKALLNSSEIKQSFQNNEDEVSFYNFLKEAVNIAEQNQNRKFFIDDKNKLDLVERFIGSINKRKTSLDLE